MWLYLAVCGVIGFMIGMVILVTVIIAPAATAVGGILRVREDLTRAVCHIPVAKDWISSDCNPDDDVQDFLDQAEAAGVNALLRASFDCSNVPPEQRKQRLCDRRSLNQIEHSAIPPEKTTLIPVFVDAGLDNRVNWGVLAAVAGARSNFGEENCSRDGGRSGGFYHFTKAEWARYKTDGGSMELDRSGQCWEVPTTDDAVADNRSPFALYDSRHDGKVDPRDPADAIATMARLLADQGARGITTWDRYNGSEANACPVDPDKDGDITPAPALGAAPTTDPAGPGGTVDPPQSPPEPAKVSAIRYTPGGPTTSGAAASSTLLGFREFGDKASGAGEKLAVGAVVAITLEDQTVYAVKVDVKPAAADPAAMAVLPAVANRLGIAKGATKQVTVSAAIGSIQFPDGATAAQINKKVRALAASSPAVPGGPAADQDVVAQITSVIKRRVSNSPLLPYVPYAVQYARQTGLEPRFILAIAGSETSFGTTGNADGLKNAWGLGPGNSYRDWPDGFRHAIDNLNGELYRGAHLWTIPQIQARWAPNGAANDPTNLNSNWLRNVSIIYTEMGGDPTRSVFTDEVATVPGVAPEVPGTGTTGTNGPEYTGRTPSDRISKAVAARIGESAPHSPCYVAQVHQWYEAITTYTAGAPPVGSAPQDGTLRARIVQILQQELAIGLGEPAGYTKYAGGRVEPWCADFQSWVWIQAGVDYPASAYSGGSAPWAAQNTILKPPTATPEPGDAVIYGYGDSPSITTSAQALAVITGQHTAHVNVVEKVYPDGTFDAIGGNQGSPGSVTRNSHIDWRVGTSSSHRVLGFAAPVKPGADVPATEPKAPKAKKAKKKKAAAAAG